MQSPEECVHVRFSSSSQLSRWPPRSMCRMVISLFGHWNAETVHHEYLSDRQTELESKFHFSYQAFNLSVFSAGSGCPALTSVREHRFWLAPNIHPGRPSVSHLVNGAQWLLRGTSLNIHLRPTCIGIAPPAASRRSSRGDLRKSATHSCLTGSSQVRLGRC